MVFSAEINAIYECKNQEQLIKYFHASLCSHPQSTLITAADKGCLQGCPGLTAAAIRKHIGVETAMECGHMKQIQKGTRSTTKTSNRGRPAKTLHQERMEAANDAQEHPTQELRNERTNFVFMTTYASEGLIASDQTGAFPSISNKGHRYVCVFYFYDANHIKGYPIKSRKKEELLRVYKLAYAYCEQRGFKPKLHKLDSETSKEVENFIKGEQATYQYAPPDMHRTNPAERAIQTWKACMNLLLPLSLPISLSHTGVDCATK